MTEIQKYQIELSSTQESIPKIEEETNSFLQKTGVGKNLYGRIFLSLIEAAQNAILHGNKQDPNKKIFITYEKKQSQIKLTVEDMGEGFNHNNLPDSTSPAHLEKENSRGLFIISNYCDDLDFNDKGNEIRMTFKLK